MDYIHCHQCYRRFSPEKLFYITSCGHIFCKNCSSTNQLPICLICSLPNVQAVPIDKQMPANVAVYFSGNLAEEQNLLTRKYEFQLFQFKHLYKHLANSEKGYEIVCRQIDKNLSEFKKCASYLKMPKCGLLTRNNESSRLASRKISTPSQGSEHSTNGQPHRKKLPYLPSPVGSSFSGCSSVRSTINNMEMDKISREDGTKQSMNGHTKYNVSRGNHAQSPHNISGYSESSHNSSISQSPLNLSQSRKVSMSSLRLPGRHAVSPVQYRGTRESAQSQQNRSQSQLILHSRSSTQSQPMLPSRSSKPRAFASPHFNRQNRLHNAEGHGPQGSFKRTEYTSSMSTTSLNDSQCTLKSQASSKHRIHPNEKSNIFTQNQCGRSTPQKIATAQRYTTRETMNTGQRTPIGYPLSGKTNLLHMQRAVLQPNFSNGSQSNQNLVRRGGDRVINHKGKEGNDRVQKGMDNRRNSANKLNNGQQEICDRGSLEGNHQFTTSPFIKYRAKPQYSPGLLDTPPSRDTTTPSSSEQKSRDQIRLKSPRTSSSLTSSNSRGRQEAPYKKPSRDLLIRTPSQSPIYRQATPPPFQETLKFLTSAVRRSNI